MLVRILRSVIFITVIGLCSLLPSVAQSVTPPQPRQPLPPVTPSQSENQPAVAPQVVTVIHRLNGLKMFRLLLRSNKDLQAVTNVDDAFRLMDDVHTNVIAGLAMDDGETIVAWLPEAEVEFTPLTVGPDQPGGYAQFSTAITATNQAGAKQASPANIGGTPELTVIGPDGRRLSARYVGMDGFTGLSVLRLMQRNPTVKALAQAGRVQVGANVHVYGPEPAEPSQPNSFFPGSLFVRMGEMSGTVQAVTLTPAGDVARLKVRSPRPKLAYVGGIAVNDNGQPVGIVDSINGTEASVLPTSLIRGAASRVLAHQASVPRPFLGVSGEPLEALKAAEVASLGWQTERAAELVQDGRGILLTSIVPGSPAALASLKAGDVILKVNNEQIQNGDDFSWWLDKAGPSTAVSFTVLRPQSTQEEAVRVKLSGSLDTRFSYNLATTPFAGPKGFAFSNNGIETIALRPAVAARFGARAGLLVVYVDPTTAAAQAGLQAGDVIQSVDGEVVVLSNPKALQITPNKTHSLEIVRKKQKMVLTLNNPDDK